MPTPAPGAAIELREQPPTPTLEPAVPAPEAAAPLAAQVAPAVAPLQSAPSVPTLPSASAPATPVAPSAAAGGMSPAQMAAIEAAKLGAPTTTTARRVPQRSVAGRIIRTGFVALLVGGLGVGARFGYDYYEHGRDGDTAASESLAVSTGFLPPIGSGLPTIESSPVSGRHVDITVMSTGIDGTDLDVADAPNGAYTTRWRYNLTGTNFTVDYQDGAVGFSVDVRGDRYLVRVDADGSWVDSSQDASVVEISEGLEAFRGFVPMFHDLVPVEAIPFTTVIAETDEQLDVVPLDPPVDAPDVAAPESVAPLVDEVTRVADEVSEIPSLTPEPRPAGPVAVRHYDLSIDVAAFARAAPFAHADWLSSGWSFEEGIEVWVDDLGVVRKFTVTEEEVTTVILNDVADEFPDFQRDEIYALPAPVLGE